MPTNFYQVGSYLTDTEQKVSWQVYRDSVLIIYFKNYTPLINESCHLYSAQIPLTVVQFSSDMSITSHVKQTKTYPHWMYVTIRWFTLGHFQCSNTYHIQTCNAVLVTTTI